MMRDLLDWIDDRTGLRNLLHEGLYESIPSGARFRYITGSMLVFAFVVQAITGIFLWMAYSPSSQTAYESVYYIQYQMTGGWLLRGVHHFMAQAMVVVMALHLLQVIWDGAYRAPREVNFWIGLILMQIVLGLGLTGYLLPWDQKGYWATNVATNLATLVPFVGKELQQLAVGGNEYGHHTLTRFFAMHAGVLPALMIVFVIAHLAVFRRHGITAKITPGRADEPFWPKQVLFDSIGCLVLLTIVLLCVVHWDVGGVVSGNLPLAHRGAELGAPADPAEQYSAARPEWYYLFLFQLLKYFPGTTEIIGAIIIPGAVMTLLALMPFIGRSHFGHKFNAGFTVVLLIGACVLTGLAWSEDYFVHVANWMQWTPAEDGTKRHPEWLFSVNKPDGTKEDRFEMRMAASRDFLAAREEAEHNAERIHELINRREWQPDGTISDVRMIPRQGAVYLLRNDPMIRGPQLFKQHCVSCHDYADAAGKRPDGFPAPMQAPKITAGGKVARDEKGAIQYDDSPTGAPNLFGFATRGWIKGLLDKEQIAKIEFGKPQLSPNEEVAADKDSPENYHRSINAPYFGNTNHRDGRMVQWVRKHAKLLADDPKKADDDVDAIAAALSAQARLPAQHASDSNAQELIRRGIGLMETNCINGCHRLGSRGQLGLAPDLTGYGSYEWMMGLVSDPTHQRFYGRGNDRMPSFAADLEHPEQNNVTPRELSLIVDWLRGQYYRPDDTNPILSHSEEQARKAVLVSRTLGEQEALVIGSEPPPPETQLARAERLYRENCAACHSHTNSAGVGIAAKSPSAPNLYGFASREWLTGFFDPEKIAGEEYFGNTRHAMGEMVTFVNDNFASLDDDGQAKVKSIIAALSAEAALPVQADADEKAEEDKTLEKGRAAIAESFDTAACTDCHKFREEGDVGSAPDLTGYGSKDWLVRFISDPAHEDFYRDTNDRMPSFGADGGGTIGPLLPPKDIELIARWLRGEKLE